MKTTLRLGLLIAACVALVVSANAVCASDGWEAKIAIRSLNAGTKLLFGQMPDATDGNDGIYDVPAMLSGQLTAFFESPGGIYWRDIKAFTPGETKTWKVKVDAKTVGAMISLNWQASSLPKALNLSLKDQAAGTIVDMTTQSEYTYMSQGPAEFEITAVVKGGN